MGSTSKQKGRWKRKFECLQIYPILIENRRTSIIFFCYEVTYPDQFVMSAARHLVTISNAIYQKDMAISELDLKQLWYLDESISMVTKWYVLTQQPFVINISHHKQAGKYCSCSLPLYLHSSTAQYNGGTQCDHILYLHNFNFYFAFKILSQDSEDFCCI